MYLGWETPKGEERFEMHYFGQLFEEVISQAIVITSGEEHRLRIPTEKATDCTDGFGKV